MDTIELCESLFYVIVYGGIGLVVARLFLLVLPAAVELLASWLLRPWR